MTQEMRPFLRSLPLRRHDLGEVRAYRGTHNGRALVAAVTGVGTEAARHATEVVLDSQDVDCVLMVGIAGGIDPALPIGSLVTPEVVVDHAGTEHHPVPLRGHVPCGVLLTSDELVADGARIDHLARQGVVAVDMETAAVGAACEQRGVDWSVLRAISDRAGDIRTDEYVVGLLKDDGAADPIAALRYMLRRPHRVFHLARLGSGSLAATRTASAAALALLSGPNQ